MMIPKPIEDWHAIVAARDLAALDRWLAEDVEFLSPVVHTPQLGRAITTAYLTAAMQVLNNDTFRYEAEWFGPHSAVLEFTTTINGIQLNGVDMIWWNQAGRVTRFKVMVRPLKAINMLHQMMGERLMAMKGG